MGSTPTPALTFGMRVSVEDENMPWSPKDEDFEADGAYDFGQVVLDLVKGDPLCVVFTGCDALEIDSVIVGVKDLTVEHYDIVGEIDLEGLLDKFDDAVFDAMEWARLNKFPFKPTWLLSASYG